MDKQDTFFFRLSDDDRAKLQALAAHLQRSQADTIRWLINSAAENLIIPESNPNDKQQPSS